jgi:O-antigen/teichoic acid export membrane protein
MKDEVAKTANPGEITGSLLVRNTLLNLFGRATPFLIGIITIPFIVRGLGVERFGLLSLAWVILSYFSIFDLGLGRATTKFVAEALGKKQLTKIPSVVLSAVIVQVIFGFSGAFIFCGITTFLVEKVLNIPSFLLTEAKDTFYVLAFSIPVVFISSSFMGILAAFQRFDLLNLIRIPSLSLTFILPLVGIFLNFDLPGIMILLLISRILFLFAYIAISAKTISFFKASMRSIKESFKLLLTFGGWVTISNIVSPILVYIDRFFIGSLLTLKAVGYYTAPSEMITRLSILPSSLMMTIFPAFSYIGEMDKERLGRLYMRAIKFLLLGVGSIIILMVLYADEILKIWLGADFVVQSVSVFQILGIGVLANSLARVPSSLLQGLGRPDITAKFHLLELPIHLLAVWFLVGKFGIKGAATAWTLRVTFDACLLFVACTSLKIAPIQILSKTGLRKNFTILLVIVLSIGIVFVIGDDLIKKSAYAIFIIFIFISMTWHYALDAAEKKVILSTFSSLVTFWKQKRK